VIVLDIPLLLETTDGRDLALDGIIVVNADDDVRVRRLVARDGLAEADARRRMAAMIWLATVSRRDPEELLRFHYRRVDEAGLCLRDRDGQPASGRRAREVHPDRSMRKGRGLRICAKQRCSRPGRRDPTPGPTPGSGDRSRSL